MDYKFNRSCFVNLGTVCQWIVSLHPAKKLEKSAKITFSLVAMLCCNRAYLHSKLAKSNGQIFESTNASWSASSRAYKSDFFKPHITSFVTSPMPPHPTPPFTHLALLLCTNSCSFNNSLE